MIESSGPDSSAVAGAEWYRYDRDVRTPALFVSFGSPLALQDQEYSEALRRFGIHLRAPRGVLIASPYWRTVRPLRVTASQRPEAIHDYGDFPSWLGKLTYPCPGSPALAAEAVALLAAAGIPAALDAQRGLDHGAWMPLSLLYSHPRMPVVQLSLPGGGSPDEMLAVGRAVAPLRQSGYLVVGSGGTVYNPHRARFDQLDAAPEPWARAFDDWIRERLDALDIEALSDYRRRAPQAHLAAPTPDHLDPLFFVLGTAMTGDRVSHVYEGFHASSLSLRTCVIAGRRKDDLRLPADRGGEP
jgi:4,5-DOPA dioxygenase extradiol